MNARHPEGIDKAIGSKPEKSDEARVQGPSTTLDCEKSVKHLQMTGADYALLYKEVDGKRRLFTPDDRLTEPRKRTDPDSFMRVADQFKHGRYDGIALIKGGEVLELWPGGRRAERAVPAAVDPTAADVPEVPYSVQAAAQFTRLSYTEPIGKHYFIDSAGQLQRENLAAGTSATAHILEIRSIEELAQEFRHASSADIFVGGVPHSDGLRVATKHSKRDADEIARSKDDLPFPNGPGVMFLDNDYPTDSGDDQFHVYARAVPALASASYVYAPSSSAWVYDVSTGTELKGAGGQHYAIPVADASDIPRALKALHQRLLLAGFGTPVVAKTGIVLIKSPVDLAMKTPNQPLFQRVVLNEGLVQRKEEHIGCHQGGVFLFDSRLISDLTADEQTRLAEITGELHLRVEEEVQRIRQQWIETRVDAVASRNNMSRGAAAACLEAALTNGASSARFDLVPGIQIKFSSGWVDVGELLANPGGCDGQPCADPLEPDYGSGVGVAKFYANPTGTPVINSHAHGGQTFFLHPDPNEIDLSGILAKLGGADSQPLRDAESDMGQQNLAQTAAFSVPGCEPTGETSVQAETEPVQAETHPHTPIPQGKDESRPDSWPALVDPFVEYAAPSFPVNQLPEAIARYCLALSAQSGFDAGGYAFALLVVASNMIDHRVRLRVGPLSLPPFLWGGIVAAAGGGKSPTISAAMKFVQQIDQEVTQASLKVRLAFIQSCEGKKPKEFESLPQPPWKQILASDTTVEALGKLLQDNPSGIFMYHDELTAFVGQMDAYNGGTGKDRAAYLAMFDGGGKTINRKSTIVPMVIENFSVGIIAGVQPEKLAELFRRGGSDGLFQRFLTYALPRPGDLDYEMRILPSLEKECERLIRQLYEWSRDQVVGDVVVEDAVLLQMEKYHQDMRTIAQRTAQARFAEHLDKFPGFLGRVMLTLHCLECAAEGEFRSALNLATFKRALEIMTVLFRHSEAVYESIEKRAGSSTELMKAACEAILTRGWKTLMRGDLTRYATGWQQADPRHAEGAIDLLIEFGWVVDVTPSRQVGRPGRRSSGFFAVNPNVHRIFAKQAARITKERAARHAAIQSVAAKRHRKASDRE